MGSHKIPKVDVQKGRSRYRARGVLSLGKPLKNFDPCYVSGPPLIGKSPDNRSPILYYPSREAAVRRDQAVFTPAAQSTRIMSYGPDVVPRWSQMTGNVFPTYKTLIQGVRTPWLAIVS